MQTRQTGNSDKPIYKKMKLGNITLDNITILAPLAGITNLPFRLIVKEAGCGLVCSEMISANALSYGSQKTIDMMHSCAEEKPVSGWPPVKMNSPWRDFTSCADRIRWL